MKFLAVSIATFFATWTLVVSSQDVILPMVVFQRDGVPSSETLLRYKETLGVLQEATFCFRVRFHQSRSLNPIISYSTEVYDNEIIIEINHLEDEFYFGCCNDLVGIRVPLKMQFRLWLSLCFAINLKQGRWILVVDGLVTEGLVREEFQEAPSIASGGILIIGQDQDSFGAGFNEFESLSAWLADLAIYPTVSAEQEMVEFTLCLNFSVSQSTILDFSNIERDFEVEGVDLETVSKSTTCDREKGWNMIFPEPRIFEEGELLCRTVGGQLAVPQNEEENMELYSESLFFQEICGGGDTKTLWLGITGDETHQEWHHYLTRTPIKYSGPRAILGEPVVHPDTCIAFRGSNETIETLFGTWVPYKCDLMLCPVCNFKEVGLIRIRGLCHESKLDREYFLTRDQGSLTFTGVLFSQISRNPPTSENDSSFGDWTLARLDNPEVKAVLHTKSPTHYPLGLNTWHVHNDVCGMSEVQLMMTSCDEKMFSCRDGSCLDIKELCNNEADCPDGSDEIGCNIIYFPKNYEYHSPPPREDRTKPVQVKFFLTLFSVRNVDLSNFAFTSEVEIRLEWADARLTLHHLKFADTLNTIDIDDEENVPWVPTLEFLGDGNTSSKVVEGRRSLWVRRLSLLPLPDNDENIREDEIFDAAFNPLVYAKKLTVTTSCNFDLEAFPFDTQTCQLRVLLSGVIKNYVVLVPDGSGVRFLGRRKLLEYYLSSETIVQQDQGKYSGLAVEVTLTNLGNFYVTSTFIPTFIIVVVGYTVFYFPLWNFNERVMVGLTCVLVEAAFFSQMNQSIPHTAYLKLVDIWFVFCIVMLFLAVVSLVIIHYIKEEPEMKYYSGNSETSLHLQQKALRTKGYRRAEKVNYFCRVFYPLVAALFIISYSIAAVSM